MPQDPDDDQLITEDEPNINTVSELPGRPFSLTMEVPLFLVMLSLSLAGEPNFNNIAKKVPFYLIYFIEYLP